MKIPTIFIPGFEINKVNKAFDSKCHIFVPTWEGHSLSYWVREFETYVEENGLTDFNAVGFSFGALIIACSKVTPRKTLLVAMTPLTKEEKCLWSEDWIKSIGGKIFSDVCEIKEKPNTTYLIGSNDTNVISIMVSRLCSQSRYNPKKVLAIGAGHLAEDYLPIVADLISLDWSQKVPQFLYEPNQ
jgi:hypothetical protein